MRLRAPGGDDAPAVLAVLVERDLADLGVADYTLADLQEEWAESDFVLASDAVVVEDDSGALVGYGVVRRPGSMAAVAPGHEGRGIGAQLLAWVQGRELERGRDYHRQWIAERNARATALLRGAGYDRARSYWRMVRVLANERGGSPPAGVALRAPDLDGEAATLHALDDAAFSVTADYRPHTLEQFIEEHIASHDIDAALSRVAEERATVVGFLLARRREHDAAGYVDILAVDPAAQSRGVGEALLRDAFAAFADAGLREAQLGVASDNPRALGLYERSGMSPRFQIDVYERPVTR
jgi:mycothiol synthase